MEQLTLTAEQIAEMVAHARAEYPHEACGLLGGWDGRVEKVYPLPNAERSPTRYLAEPQAQVDAMLEIEERGWEMPLRFPLYGWGVAICHSHPDSPVHPSATDLEMAYYPDSLYFIISLAARFSELPADKALIFY